MPEPANGIGVRNTFRLVVGKNPPPDADRWEVIRDLVDYKAHHGLPQEFDESDWLALMMTIEETSVPSSVWDMVQNQLGNGSKRHNPEVM